MIGGFINHKKIFQFVGIIYVIKFFDSLIFDDNTTFLFFKSSKYLNIFMYFILSVIFIFLDLERNYNH